MEKEFLELKELQQVLKQGVECIFPGQLWVKAEINSIKARPGGHCYLELCQTDASGIVVAKVSANIWANSWRIIAAYFEKSTGSPLQAGITVLVKVRVQYSEVYGLSLNITDIDPEMTLGQQEMLRRENIARLEKEGLMKLQKELPFPSLPYRVAVISAPDAAGYRDFMKHLENNEFGFRFHTVLFPALMQGLAAPASIIEALDSIYGELEEGAGFNLVMLMRGGGSSLDLACFDDYDLAAHIAAFPIPVLTGLGHDQDYHIADMVAHMHVKTPTALADFLIGLLADEDARISMFEERIARALAAKFAFHEARLERFRDRIRNAFTGKIRLEQARLDLLSLRIRAANPRNILEKGYVLALDGRGAVLKSAVGLNEGDRLSMMFRDGTVGCEVKEVKKIG